MFKPMLAESAKLADVGQYINDGNFFAQPKVDGHRMLVFITDGQVTVLNRAGMPKTTMLTHRTLAAFEDFDRGSWTFDGEFANGTLWLFDMVNGVGMITPASCLEDRLIGLERTFTEWKPNADIRLLPTARTWEEKASLIRRSQDEFAEGVMLKDRRGTYEPGRRSRHSLKLKFVKELDAIITDLHHEGKDNAVLSLLDPENNRVLEIGRASTIGKKPIPAVGQVWTVRYLYTVDPGRPRLYQPRLMHLRTDKPFEECLVDQLVFTNKNVVIDRSRDDM